MTDIKPYRRDRKIRISVSYLEAVADLLQFYAACARGEVRVEEAFGKPLDAAILSLREGLVESVNAAMEK